MYSGWTVKWPVNRKLTPQEKADVLPRAKQPDTSPDDHGALTGFNSTYAEFIDRRFRLRGWLITLACTLWGFFLPLHRFLCPNLVTSQQ